MLIEKESKLLVCHRRLFHEDSSRFFVGSVEDYQDGLVRMSGYTWQQDMVHGGMFRKQDKRTKIIPLTSHGYITYQLPLHVDIKALQVVFDKAHMFLKDPSGFSMDITDRLPLEGSPD